MKYPCLRRLRTLCAKSPLIACLGLAMMQATAHADQDVSGSRLADVNAPKQPDNSFVLARDKPSQREIALNETHSYRIVLVAGQYLNVIVDQRDADVEIRCIGPDGKRIGSVIRRVRTPVPTPISFIAAIPGEHRLELTHVKVRLSINKVPKFYEIKISELRPSTPYDVSRLSIRSSDWLEANKLLREGTPESRQKAFEKFEENLRRLRVFGDRRAEAAELDGLAAMFSTREPQKALYFANQALALYRDLGEVRSHISMLIISGINYGVLGELDKELGCYTEALALSRAMGDRDTELRSLDYLRMFYRGIGDKQKVAEINIEMEPLNSALAEEEKAALQVERAAALQKTREASDLVKQGTPQSRQSAFERYEDALRLFRTAGDREGEVETLIGLGRVTALQGDKKKALDLVEQAMLLAKANKTPYELGTSTLPFYSVGKAYEALGEMLKAIDVYTFMIKIFRARKVTSAETDLHSRISRLYESLDDKAKALEHLNLALQLLQSLLPYNESALANMRGRIAKIESDRGNLRESLVQIEATLELIERRRTKIVSQDIQASYFASSQRYYEFYIDVLMRLNKEHPSDGYAIRALQASERARARSLNEVLAEANTSISVGIDPDLLERRKKLQEQLNAGAALESGLNETPDQRDRTNRKLWELTTAYHQVEALIRRSNPKYAALTQPAPLTLSQLQNLLDSDTVLLEYSLGTERSYLWLVTATSFASYELPAQSTIEDEVKRLVGLFKDGKLWATNNQTASKYLPAATQLSQLLFPESARGLFGKRLLIVPDGALQYLAFGALPSLKTNNWRTIGAVPLIVDHEIVTIPSVSTLAVLRSKSEKRPAATKSVVVMADPVFETNDERISRPTLERSRLPRQENDLIPNSTAKTVTDLQRSVREVLTAETSDSAKIRIPRLPFSREEANAIFTSAPAGEAVKAVDFQANRANATGQAVSQSRIVHFATHGLLNSEHPELSGIILSLVNENGEPIDGFLRLHEIYNLNLRADLVVLSACQTGLGKEIRGEGLVGLTRGFMYAGASQVVASLWKVDDVSTAELMKIFYRKMLRERKSAAAGLREAQIEMWKSKRWHQPYYWAAFQLQGEWK